ncbi:anthranilate phosphoribosyltransferase [Psychrobacillus lasiicapitis]|uniref:Anthranilate phosphoribosyltransferase n=1 Tax=Psychrobacillus lasiicapitis TaxID=1636719 RepID=A0A544TH51_9BACI|nr:anthranilate phosphoribosyltransferase [Psychrobacillus lasiicapitis]TQR16758.1 anthranilate phosphoribosyltransferase [Psychrobacillus lasiicapitis]GGA27455.1 anthranilate phosphoribosyltransferase [Psychrobacillus lasiicapitis]
MRNFIEKVEKNEHLQYEEMIEASRLMFDEATELQTIADFLIALSKKGETANEVAALATVMKSFALKLNEPAGNYMDNCGTGGDGLKSFNISTTSAFVLAGAGASVAKHGNRKISSAAGSSDVLEALGIDTTISSEASMDLLAREGLTFLYAPSVHPKLKRIGQVRQQIGKPTIFNLIGPLTNPIELAAQYTGINRPDFTMEYATVLQMLGRERAIIVCGALGMDEASLAGKNSFVLVDKGDLIPFTLTPEDVGLRAAPVTAIRGGDAFENAKIMRSVLQGERSPFFDTVIFNAGVGLYANAMVGTIQEGVKLAADSILSGKALAKLESVIDFSNNARKQEVV